MRSSFQSVSPSLLLYHRNCLFPVFYCLVSYCLLPISYCLLPSDVAAPVEECQLSCSPHRVATRCSTLSNGSGLLLRRSHLHGPSPCYPLRSMLRSVLRLVLHFAPCCMGLDAWVTQMIISVLKRWGLAARPQRLRKNCANLGGGCIWNRARGASSAVSACELVVTAYRMGGARLEGQASC